MDDKETSNYEMFSSLDDRDREVFRRIVESYLETGEPLGSRNLSRLLSVSLSPASVRDIMSDLELFGLIYSPHVSAGRLPTQLGLRFFLDTFMQTRELSEEDQLEVENQIGNSESNKSLEEVMSKASKVLSGISRGAGLVFTTKRDLVLKHIEFIRLDSTKALAVIVGESDQIENRIINLPTGITSSQLIEAANFLNAQIVGQTFSAFRFKLEKLKDEVRRELDTLSHDLVERGLAVWSGAQKDEGKPSSLIIRGRANLLEGIEPTDLERLRLLFDDLEKKEVLIEMLHLTESSPGVRIFIGSENKLFSLSGSSLVIAGYSNKRDQIIGAVGVIGPTRLNYARIVPIVDYTAQIMSRAVLDKS
ncbi:Heat-inducible transcription repressor HrcA [Liberibacter crescens BT-1]|uniref:Heat-inducible transcription repressor HrcA n=1 Tax=Liberibacter crescens (strain BT-1) TaxID=1215343 RepID=L0EUF9_LIBCB|nr:heat-inducible transcriptional repressor HrcA [Liberibacter crescens]AGA65189.1 Heat-inducible transcription repressor HrcA [Liberibacter crescens BT-1]AMC13145.1 heat-inducible transcription repressor [Liberibacter crescens]